MILRADDFKDRGMFLSLIEEAQALGIVKKGPLSWDEGDSVVDLSEVAIDVRPRPQNPCPDCFKEMTDDDVCVNPECVRNFEGVRRVR